MMLPKVITMIFNPFFFFTTKQPGGKEKALSLRDSMMTSFREDMANRRDLIVRQIGLRVS